MTRLARAISLALALSVTAPAGANGQGTAAAGTQGEVSARTQTEVRELLERYATALESLDANAVKKVQPSIPLDGLTRAFRDMRTLSVDIDEIRVLSIDGALARVSCRVTQTLTPRVGSRQTTAVTRVMRLRRGAADWVIDGFER